MTTLNRDSYYHAHACPNCDGAGTVDGDTCVLCGGDGADPMPTTSEEET